MLAHLKINIIIMIIIIEAVTTNIVNLTLFDPAPTPARRPPS